VTSEEAPLDPEASSVEEIYNQIITDLTDAEGLPIDGEIQEGRATQGAAKSLLAKVYLRKGEYELAANKAKEVIDSNKYALWDSFDEAFDLSSRGGKEAVFSVGFGDAGGAISFWEVGQFNVRLLPTELSANVDGISNTQGWQISTPYIYDSFSDSDQRKEATFMNQFTATDGSTVNLNKIYIDKYWDRVADPTAAGSTNDFQVIRYPDVLLIYAEAEMYLGNLDIANEYLNKVRTRAGLEDEQATDMTQFINLLVDQRGKEFVAEGQRWFDLTRLNKLEEAVQSAKGISVASQYYLFPIPQRERDVNPNLPQNTGY
jgi:hypothetical protein